MSDVSPTELNRSTLRRQLLLERSDLSIDDTLRHVGAIQAQDPAAPYVALWNRIADLDLRSVDAAFADRSLVKAPLMRVTLHAVNAEDYSTFHSACLSILRASRLNDRRFRDTGLTTTDADSIIEGLLDFTRATRSKSEIESYLAGLGDRFANPRLWWALRTFAPIHHAPSGPPWSFSHTPQYVAAPRTQDSRSTEAALEFLVRRYLGGFGPASVADIAQFTLQKRPGLRAAIERLGAEVKTLAGPGGVELFDLADRISVPDGSAPAPARLMAMWDSTLLAYKDRSRIIPDVYRQHVIRRNGDTLPTILVDGLVAGVWRVVDGGAEVTAFHRLDIDTWDQLEAEAVLLVESLADRDPPPFKRYHRWWSQLPCAQQRTFTPS